MKMLGGILLMNDYLKPAQNEVNHVIQEKLAEYPENVQKIVLDAILLSKNNSSAAVEKILEARLREMSKGEIKSDS